MDRAHVREVLARKRAAATAVQPQATPVEAPAVPVPPEPPPGKPAKPPKAPKEPSPTGTYICGHKESLAHTYGRACPACQNEGRRRKAEKRRAGQGAKAERRPEGRLPDGATFAAVYNAAAVAWDGSLTVGGKMFTTSAGGVFKLMTALDALYRASLQDVVVPWNAV
jgi:hypothetical protein